MVVLVHPAQQPDDTVACPKNMKLLIQGLLV